MSRVSLLVAALLLPTLVSANDLPVLPDDYEPVDICAHLGKGYILIPETETCMRIQVGVQTDFGVNIKTGGSGNYVLRNRATGPSTSIGTAITTHTQTPFGPLRTHIGAGFDPNN
ncbi:MAG: porin [Pseudomonadota bacterium]